jgi:ActR/RegA family two-component response regulator
LALSEAEVNMQALSAVRFAVTAVCVLNVGGCGIATSVDATNLDAQNYQSSAADYRNCLAAYPNDPKVCEGRRLIMETNQRALSPSQKW